VYTGRQDLGALNIYIAMAIAVFKASLVVLFFMHMTEAAGTNRLVFLTSFVFMFVMMLGVFGDMWTRNEMSLPSSAPSTLAPEFQVPGETPAHHE
jgi:cytochrome c oxidase subunit 4